MSGICGIYTCLKCICNAQIIIEGQQRRPPQSITLCYNDFTLWSLKSWVGVDTFIMQNLTWSSIYIQLTGASILGSKKRIIIFIYLILNT